MRTLLAAVLLLSAGAASADSFQSSVNEALLQIHAEREHGGCCRDRGGDHGGDHDRDGYRDRDRRRDDERDYEREERRRQREWDEHNREWWAQHPYRNPNDQWNGSPRGGAGQPPAGGAPGGVVLPVPDGPPRVWDRWPGHPGWGKDHAWAWHRGVAYWWGWKPFTPSAGSTHMGCVSHFNAQDDDCEVACAADNGGCVKSCAQYAPNDPSCPQLCGVTEDSCVERCRVDRDSWIGRCPL